MCSEDTNKASYFIYITTKSVVCERSANPKRLYKRLYDAPQATYYVARSSNVVGWLHHIPRISAFVTRHYSDAGGRARDVRLLDYGYRKIETKVSAKQKELF